MEVGVRIALGATRLGLIAQFLFESFLVSIPALLIALAFVVAFLQIDFLKDVDVGLNPKNVVIMDTRYSEDQGSVTAYSTPWPRLGKA